MVESSFLDILNNENFTFVPQNLLNPMIYCYLYSNIGAIDKIQSITHHNDSMNCVFCFCFVALVLMDWEQQHCQPRNPRLSHFVPLLML